MKVLVVEPRKKPFIKEIDGSLKSMQAIVDGLIEVVMPFDDEVALICNDEGKINGYELNRAIKDENGETLDIIAGTFFLCYAPIESEDFLSLSDELAEKYTRIFY